MAQSAQTKRIALEIEAFSAKKVVQLAFEIEANLRAEPPRGGTPVKTGWARANWLQSVGTPASPVANPLGEDQRRAAVSAANSAQSSGLSEVAGYNNLGQSVFVTNNVPYIQDLNDGSSRQAPSGFVQAAVQKAVRDVAKRK